MPSGVYCIHASKHLLYRCHQAFLVYMSSCVYCIHAIRRLLYTTIRRLLYTTIRRLLYTCHKAFVVYMPSGVYGIQPSDVYSGAVYYTHIILYSGSSLCGSCCSSRQITCFRVLIPYRAVRSDFGIKMMFGSSLAQLVFFRGGD